MAQEIMKGLFGLDTPIQEPQRASGLEGVLQRLETGASAGIRRGFGQKTALEAQQDKIRGITEQMSSEGINLASPKGLTEFGNRLTAAGLSGMGTAMMMQGRNQFVSERQADADIRYKLASAQKAQLPDPKRMYIEVMSKNPENRSQDEKNFAQAFEKASSLTKSTTNMQISVRDQFESDNKSYQELMDSLTVGDKAPFSQQSLNTVRQEIFRTDQLLGLLDSGLKTGFGQENLAELEKVFKFFSPDFELSEQAKKAEVFAGIAKLSILPQVKSLGVNPTDTDLKFIKDASAGLGKSVAGNLVLLKTLALVNKRKKRYIDAFNEFDVNWSKNTSPNKSTQKSRYYGWKEEERRLFKEDPILKTTDNPLVKQLEFEKNQILGSNKNVTLRTKLKGSGLTVN